VTHDAFYYHYLATTRGRRTTWRRVAGDTRCTTRSCCATRWRVSLTRQRLLGRAPAYALPVTRLWYTRTLFRTTLTLPPSTLLSVPSLNDITLLAFATTATAFATTFPATPAYSSLLIKSVVDLLSSRSCGQHAAPHHTCDYPFHACLRAHTARTPSPSSSGTLPFFLWRYRLPAWCQARHTSHLSHLPPQWRSLVLVWLTHHSLGRSSSWQDAGRLIPAALSARPPLYVDFFYFIARPLLPQRVQVAGSIPFGISYLFVL